MQKTDGHYSPTTERAGDHACGLRRCAQCGYLISDAMVGRCPRCWGALPRMECGGCSGCSIGLPGKS